AVVRRAICYRKELPPSLHRHAVESAELVAVGIAHIGQVEWAKRPRPDAGRILDRRAPMRDCCVMPGIHLLGAVNRETDCRAVPAPCPLSCLRRTHHEQSAFVKIIHALVVLTAKLGSHRIEQGIVKTFRSIDVVRPDHHMAEHSVPSLSKVPPTECSRPRASARSPC